ncbi:MAG: HAMP domain-containing protein [Dehalococcoidia bacterium]|nr:HAMP domain-containing protein [Dehalococcoidia bacterium]
MPAFALTVRFRLTVWYSSLLLVFGVAFVVALNLAARLDQPDIIAYQLEGVNDVEWQPVRGPGNAISGFQPVLTTRGVLKQAEEQIYSDNLDRLRTWSLLAVVGLAAASGIGGYVLSGMMLRPVRDITRVASEISATNLKQRINHEGPEDELWALSQTFDSMIDRLEQSFEKQRQFVQDASHELRTPLAAIRTNIEVTESDPDATTEDFRDLIETVKVQTARLTRLSEDLLLLTTSDPEQLDREPVDIAAISHEVGNQLGPLAASRSITIRTEGLHGIEVETNADLLYRCVFNLTDNAVKYSNDGSDVVIRVSRLPGEARIDVIDHGPGISPEDRERIFDRFYRADKARSRQRGGNGLGLAIVRDLVTALGGRVSVESAPGAGSTFTIRMPLAPVTFV